MDAIDTADLTKKEELVLGIRSVGGEGLQRTKLKNNRQRDHNNPARAMTL